MAKMSDADLGELIARRRDASLHHLNNKLSNSRKEANQFYRGDNLDLYGNSGDGLSTVVSRDFLEAVESMLPGLIKPFVAGDETVRFEPKGPEDEEGAKQATEYINYLFQNHNDAVRVIYDFTKDGLQYKLGIAKVVHETVDDKVLETYQGLDALQVEAIEAEDDHEIVGDVVENPDGTFDVRCSKSVEKAMYRVYVIAPDEFMFEERLAALDDSRFLGHRATKPVGDFVAMGLPKAKVLKLSSHDADNDEADDRHDQEDWPADDDKDFARLVTVDECYVRCDYEGTGTLGWRKVFMGSGSKDIISNEEADDHPYACWTPIPVPHKLVGMSVFDLTRDLQMQGTAIIREAYNALYLSNRPMREVVEGQVNFEDLLNPAAGGFARVKQPGMIREIPSGGEGVIEQSLVMLENIASQREQRTGSTRYNQGMDANSLNKTATGISIIQNASTQRQELVARHLAEGMKSIFKKMLGLVCRHGDKAEVIRLRGQWVEMDPRSWNAGYDMSVSVGLGSGNRMEQVGQLTNLLNIDQQIIEMQGGAEGPIVTQQNVYEKLKRMVEAMGLKDIENYYTDPTPQPGPEGEPQPANDDEPVEPDPMAQFAAEQQTEIEKARIEAGTKIKIAEIQAEADIVIGGIKQGFVPDQVIDENIAPQPQEDELAAMVGGMPPPPPDEAYMPSGEPFMEGDEPEAMP